MAKYHRANHSRWRWRRVTQIMARDGEMCSICGERLSRKVDDHTDPLYITFDHITPISRGGTTELPNLRLAHRFCNSTRGNDPLMPEQEN